MARLQILELPEGTGDDRPPFVLVVDQYEPRRYMMGLDQTQQSIDEFDGIPEKLGARAVLVFADTVDIPANDTTAYLAAHEPEIRLKLDDREVRDAVASDALRMRAANQDRILDAREARIDAQRLADERTDIARDMDRLAKRKNELLDALGMDRTRDWDDIRNAASGLRKQRDAQAAELEELRAGEEPAPVIDERVRLNPGQWIWTWNRSTQERRLSMAAQILEGMPRANDCLMLSHATELAELRAEVARLRLGRVPDGSVDA
jgi:hypothetical protein